jgi:predicted DNA-binding transcriptional regulator YafY
LKRLDRLLAMALLVSGRRRLRGEDLARQFRVSVRTVYRDLRALQEAGFERVEVVEEKGYGTAGLEEHDETVRQTAEAVRSVKVRAVKPAR